MSQQLVEILSDEIKFTRAAKAAFQTVDTDGSGEIDLNELKAAMDSMAAEMGFPAPKKEDVLDLMKDLDTDRSGKIDFNEFKSFFRDILKSMSS